MPWLGTQLAPWPRNFRRGERETGEGGSEGRDKGVDGRWIEGEGDCEGGRDYEGRLGERETVREGTLLAEGHLGRRKGDCEGRKEGGRETVRGGGREAMRGGRRERKGDFLGEERGGEVDRCVCRREQWEEGGQTTARKEAPSTPRDLALLTDFRDEGVALPRLSSLFPLLSLLSPPLSSLSPPLSSLSPLLTLPSPHSSLIAPSLHLTLPSLADT
ncbi:hypothetical protein Pmani_018043 [Petrolisthes manimaculis]|uniref:Uncharacterized protein n=1 Tax=Petrolisthes manimaculis TaxID=1843537 RepID=A0AAE1PKZ5_9EUCA|nr:hypothetical protein Pmani_018043 [Petrolisthes manimaculis]